MWIKFTAIAGIPGLLTLLAMRSLPGRVRCDSCRRPRLVTRSRCEHCAAEFSAPPAEGIEVFEAA
jgi:predicted amidophosphoribosyltransferase